MYADSGQSVLTIKERKAAALIRNKASQLLGTITQDRLLKRPASRLSISGMVVRWQTFFATW